MATTRTGGKAGRPRKPRPRSGVAVLPAMHPTTDVAVEPDDLDEAGRSAWFAMAEVLGSAGVADWLNLSRLSDLAHMTDRLVQARTAIRKLGPVVAGSRGTSVVNPACLVERDCVSRIEVLRRVLREEVEAATAGRPDPEVERWLRVVDEGYGASE